MTDVYAEETSPNGDRYWLKNGGLHRDGDDPAAIYADGTRYWYRDGQLHRDGDDPAVIYADGTRVWYRGDRIHRDGDEPAAIYADGTRYWYKNDRIHRDGDEPAVIYASGTREWYRNGQWVPKPNLQSAQKQAIIPTFSALTADELIRHIDNLPGEQSSELLRAIVAKLIESTEEIAYLEQQVAELRDDLELIKEPQE
jgi:hypothetical protein